MIRKLCNYLRNMGFDTEMISDSDSIESIEKKSIEEKRIVLTRNKLLFNRKSEAPVYFIFNQDATE